MAPITVTSIRRSSTLAEKLRLAASSNVVSLKATNKPLQTEESLPGEFNEMFIMPKRKLGGQLQIERATGRTAIEQRSRIDIHDRLSVRSERSREMATDQDWPSVWPAARTFNASAVPLPVRMGSRPDPEKRAPFKKQGNLELVKIPNFLHLTPAAIERHCEALKQFCTKFPSELEDPAKLEEYFPVSIQYNDYVHQGTNIRDMRARVITMQIKLASLGLKEEAREKLIRLAGNKYDESSDILTIITDRCHTRKQNSDYANYLLTVLFHESNKVEEWEKVRERRDNLKVEFDGSKCKDELLRVLQSEGQQVDEKEPKIAEFKTFWKNYRNSEETPESVRDYGRKMKEILGIKSQ